MNRLIYLMLLLNYSSCVSQLNGTFSLQEDHYANQLEKAKKLAINSLDINELKFSLQMNKDFDQKDLGSINKVINVPYLEIQDNCFVAINCNYSHENFLYCLTFKKPEYKEYFIQFNESDWTHFIYSIKDNKKSTFSKDLYMFADICKITDLVKYSNRELVSIDRNLCFFEDNMIYTFLNGKPIPFHKFYSDWPGHKPPLYIDGCVMPEE